MKCTHCGGEVLIQPGSRIGICTRCMSEVPIPDTSVSASLYEQAGLALRESRFDEAIEIYRRLLIENPDDAAVCWGMALGEYGIEYVTDPASGEQLPTLHRLSLERFSEYLYAKKAVDLSWNRSDRDFYVNQCALIDSIQVESLSISKQEIPVDVFICYKRSESFDQGNTLTAGTVSEEKRTADSRMAADYYRELTRRGYKVFFAEETLHVGEEYEPRIFAALNSAKVMIALATKKEYYEAAWVRNEWSRYVDLIEQDMKESGSTQRLLIPVFNHMEHAQLPEALAQMPSFVEMQNTPNPKMALMNLVAAHFDRGKAEDVSSIVRQVRGSSRTMSTTASGAGGADTGESAQKTRTLATIRLVNGEFEEARRLFNMALGQRGGNQDPENFLGLMMCRYEIPGREALAQYAGLIDDNAEFLKAVSVADAAAKEELLQIAQNCRENVQWQKETAGKREECRSIAKAVRDGNGRAYQPFEEIEERCAQYDKLKETVQGPSWASAMFYFFLLANLLPLVILRLLNLLHSDGMFASMLLVPTMVVGQTIAYFAYAFSLLGFASEKGGILSYLKLLIKLGLLAALAYGMLQIERINITGMSSGTQSGSLSNGLPVTMIAIAAFALIVIYLYFFIILKKKSAYKSRVRDELEWLRSSYENLDQIASEVLEALNSETDSATKPYQRYYSNWEKAGAEFMRDNQETVDSKADTLRELLSVYEEA